MATLGREAPVERQLSLVRVGQGIWLPYIDLAVRMIVSQEVMG